MRNITFVIAFFMLSMFSVHAQHIYYKLDRESNALQQIPETNELREFLYDSESRWILDSDGVITNQLNNLNSKHYFEIFQSQYLTNEIIQDKEVNFLVFKSINVESIFNHLDLTNNDILEKIIFMYYDEMDSSVLLNLVQYFQISSSVEVLFIKGSVN